MDKTKIALVDDHPLFRRGLRGLVNTFPNFIVILEAENGRQLIQKLNKEDLPDIIMLDILMPEMNGFETAQWLRTNYPQIKIIVFTVLDTDEAMMRMFSLGVKGFLLKDVGIEEIRKVLESVALKGFYYSSWQISRMSDVMPSPRHPRQLRLTAREIEFIKLAAKDFTYSEIASKMNVSARTIENYMYILFQKLDVKSRVGIVLQAIKNNLFKNNLFAFEQLYMLQESNLSGKGYTDRVQNPGAEITEANVSVYAPPKVYKGESFLVQVKAHTSFDQLKADTSARKIDAESSHIATHFLDKQVDLGSLLCFQLIVASAGVINPIEYRPWNGQIIDVQFEVNMPFIYNTNSIICTLIVSENSIPIGQVKWKLIVLPPSPDRDVDNEPGYFGRMTRYRHVFVSYANADRSEVLKRVQMLPRRGMEITQDIFSFEPGDKWDESIYKGIDKADVFFLFWSTAAKNSEWVMREVRYAISRQQTDLAGNPEIVPIPIEGPPPVAPPKELQHLHFNDKFLYFISGST